MALEKSTTGYAKGRYPVWNKFDVHTVKLKNELEFEADMRVTLKNQKKSWLGNLSDLTIAEFEFEPGSIEMSIKGSFMNLTNIRMFNDILSPEKHNKTLTENIIRDSNYLILADNCNRAIRTTNYEYGTEEPVRPKNNLPQQGFRVP